MTDMIKARKDMIKKNICPMVEVQHFMWYAEYKDGTMDTEFKADLSETPFDNIKRDQLMRKPATEWIFLTRSVFIQGRFTR